MSYVTKTTFRMVYEWNQNRRKSRIVTMEIAHNFQIGFCYRVNWNTQPFRMVAVLAAMFKLRIFIFEIIFRYFLLQETPCLNLLFLIAPDIRGLSSNYNFRLHVSYHRHIRILWRFHVNVLLCVSSNSCGVEYSPLSGRSLINLLLLCHCHLFFYLFWLSAINSNIFIISLLNARFLCFINRLHSWYINYNKFILNL